MQERKSKHSVEDRRAPRVELDGAVTIRFEAASIVGSGQNIAEQGVFFTAAGSLPVTVELAGAAGPITGDLVRLESMGDGRIGIAVKFHAPHPELIAR
jgi:hypothetical protein